MMSALEQQYSWEFS